MKHKLIQLILKTTLILMFAGGVACSQKNNASEAQGGVDGSGGELPAITEQSFNDWLANQHQAYVRDFFYRIFWLQKNSNTDLQIMSGLDLKFLGNNFEEFNSFLKKIKYISSANGCPIGINGDDGKDAAAYSDLTICYSHRAFKNMSIQLFIPKILSMTVHEIAHLRGFGEAEAVKLQLAFEDTNLSQRTILAFNNDYRTALDQLEHVGKAVTRAFTTLLRKDINSQMHACAFVYVALDRHTDYINSMDSIPSSLNQIVRSNIFMELENARRREDCFLLNQNELIQIIVSVLENIKYVRESLTTYESSYCSDGRCSGVSLMNFRVNANLFLWNVSKDNFLTNNVIESADEKSVTCRLFDITEGKEIKMNRTIDGYALETNDLILNQNFTKNIYIGTGDNPSVVEVSLESFNDIYSLDLSNFIGGKFSILGFLNSTKLINAKIKFAILQRIPGKISLGQFIPYVNVVDVEPKALKTLELNCSYK